MTDLVHELVFAAAARDPSATALADSARELAYEELAGEIRGCACGLADLGLAPADRVAVYGPKRVETVVAMFAAAAAGGAFVPVNPVLKARQVVHILQDCDVVILVTTADRLRALGPELGHCPGLRTIVLLDEPGETPDTGLVAVRSYRDLAAAGTGRAGAVHRRIDTDMAAILYTSGSTGRPKGVVLSHRNLVAGARTVAGYLENRPEDRILSVLTLSFDAGLNQITTAFSAGASAVLLEYLLPRDVVRAVVRSRITGLAGVPPLWIQLADLDWPDEAAASLRYLTNTGGAMPTSVTGKLREKLPRTRVYLMYGLTEAFRSTYLPPELVDVRADSIGKAVPNADIQVVREDGTECDPGEPGELVHRGALVAMGYWNDPEKTASRFRPAPNLPAGLTVPEIAVWSGDTVRRDEDGFLYFVGRRDEMIKTSGYRVSPTEIEEVAYGTGLVTEAVAAGVPHERLGQSIALFVVPAGDAYDEAALLEACRTELPNYMVPATVVARRSLPRNPNGKIDRARLVAELENPEAAS